MKRLILGLIVAVGVIGAANTASARGPGHGGGHGGSHSGGGHYRSSSFRAPVHSYHRHAPPRRVYNYYPAPYSAPGFYYSRPGFGC